MRQHEYGRNGAVAAGDGSEHDSCRSGGDDAQWLDEGGFANGEDG